MLHNVVLVQLDADELYNPNPKPNPAQHHDALNKVQSRVALASAVAQALTKRALDGSRERGTFTVGDKVLVYRAAPNRMLPHFTGPYDVQTVSEDENFVTAGHYLDAESVVGPVHVSRLVHFDGSRVSAVDIAEYQLDTGSYIVDGVIKHRMLADGSIDFHIRWRGTPQLPRRGVKAVVKVQDYCKRVGLPPPGKEPRRAVKATSASTAAGAGAGSADVTARGRGSLRVRGRGRS